MRRLSIHSGGHAGGMNEASRSSPSPSSRRFSTGSEVIAATAGQDNWKTWAGRSHGSEGFELWDPFRYVNRKFKSKFLWSIPPAGTPCPVCYMVPESKSEWHITSSCGHAVCADCLQGYAASLVRDPEHHGPLKCPVCPLPLRPRDAIKALASDAQLIALWDAKIRNEVLRALPGYRHCPHCQNNDDGSNSTSNNNRQNNTHNHHHSNNNNKLSSAAKQKKSSSSIAPSPYSSLVGGGFVTPECLAPINKEREQVAISWLHNPCMEGKAMAFLYGLYVAVYVGSYATHLYVDLVNIVAPIWPFRRFWLLARHWMAGQARKALFEPITVECPCCDHAFILSAESELGNNIIADEATQEWIGSNTRPCPSCSCPISKIEGCNHMQCSHCRAKFCWACMRLGSACAAYNCRNGAPFGNAGIPVEDGQNNNHGNNNNNANEGGILGLIDRIEHESTTFDHRDAIIGGISWLSLVFRKTVVVQAAARIFVTFFAFLFSTGFIFAVVLVFIMKTMTRQNGRRLQLGVRNFVNGNVAEDVAAELFQVDNALERRMMAIALRRSLVEQ